MSTTTRVNKLIITDANNVYQSTLLANNIGKASDITANTTSINNLTTNLSNNYATSASIASAYLLKSDAANTYTTPSQVSSLIATSGTTQVVTPTVTVSASSTATNTSGTIALNKSLFTYNTAAKVLGGSAGVTVPTVPDATQVSEFTVTIAAPSGTTFSAASTFMEALTAYSFNSTTGYTAVQYLIAKPVVITSGSIVLDVIYQANNASDAHTFNMSFRALSSS